MDYSELAASGMNPELLAERFIEEHFDGAEPEYPVNPFQLLRDCGVVFSLRPFDKYEGLYFPAEHAEDIPVVGINLDRPIARQRYTAAHELCHHLKDAKLGAICPIGSRSAIERYAEKFAACLLMPRTAMARQIMLWGRNVRVTPDDVLRIAEYFGVSFSACLYRVAFDFHALKGSPSAEEVKRIARTFGSVSKRRKLGFTDAVLYRQLLDAAADTIRVEFDPAKRQLFEANYIYHDSRMEGIDIDQETAAEIVVDLRINGAASKYCSEENSDLIEVAGLKVAYDYVFGRIAERESVGVYDAKTFNEKLFSLSPHPEYGGRFRESNTLVVGAKFETMDYRSIPAEFLSCRKELDAILDRAQYLSPSEYVGEVVEFHHRLTVLHPFRDGNGRSTRGLANLLFLLADLPPVQFIEKSKNEYRDALASADKLGNCDELFCIYVSHMFETFATLSDVAL